MNGVITEKPCSVLGIRFWDPVTDNQVRDGLRVTARPLYASGPKVRANRTRSDIYAFHGLPGMRAFEYRLAYSEASPPEQKAFIIEIEDYFRRYNPVALRVALPLPYRGVFLSNMPGSPYRPSPQGFLLYSAPSRIIPSQMALVRGELTNAITGRPAAHAVVQVRLAGGQQQWHGVADDGGRFLVVFPYPTIEYVFSGSPPTIEFRPLKDQRWTVSVEVLYEPNRQEKLPFASVPEYLGILTQRRASIVPEASPTGSPAGMSGAVPALLMNLEYGKELVIRTQGLSTLMISPQ